MSNKRDYQNEQRKFEFTIYLNENIIVQRFFNIIGFNKKAINSLNFKEALDINQEVIQWHLKCKTIDYLNDNKMSFFEDPNFDKNDFNDTMRFVVKMNGNVIGFREWDATTYPTKVRYTVDVREHIYDIITRVQKCLSDKNENLETTYLNYNLAVR